MENDEMTYLSDTFMGKYKNSMYLESVYIVGLPLSILWSLRHGGLFWLLTIVLSGVLVVGIFLRPSKEFKKIFFSLDTYNVKTEVFDTVIYNSGYITSVPRYVDVADKLMEMYNKSMFYDVIFFDGALLGLVILVILPNVITVGLFITALIGCIWYWFSVYNSKHVKDALFRLG